MSAFAPAERWTEYGVRIEDSPTCYAPFDSRREAENYAAGLKESGLRTTVVGRTVTASDWLPVDGEGR